MSNPALLATYFCRDPAAADGLVETFIRPAASLALSCTPDGEWRNPQEKTRLWRGRLPGMDGGDVVQLVLNAPEPTPRGWQILWERLLRAQDGAPGVLGEELWGYTLLYQASVAPGESETAEERVQEIPPEPWSGTLTEDAPYGQLSLLATPQGDGAKARTVYAIFCSAEKEKALARDWTWAPGGQLLALELALHRAQHQRRQYQAVASTVENAVKGLWDTTHGLLTGPKRVTPGGEKAELNALADQYSRLSVATSDLRLLRRTLAIQTANAHRVATDLGLADAKPVRHQLDLLQETEVQVEEYIGYARETVEAAQVTLALLNARFQERQARAQEWRNRIIAFLGLTLAAGQLITDETARSFLRWVTVLFRLAPGPYTTAQVFASRLALAVLIGLIGMGIVWEIEKLRQAVQQR